MVQNYISVVSQIEMALKLQKMTKLQENDDVVKVLVKVGQHFVLTRSQLKLKITNPPNPNLRSELYAGMR